MEPLAAISGQEQNKETVTGRQVDVDMDIEDEDWDELERRALQGQGLPLVLARDRTPKTGGPAPTSPKNQDDEDNEIHDTEWKALDQRTSYGSHQVVKLSACQNIGNVAGNIGWQDQKRPRTSVMDLQLEG